AAGAGRVVARPTNPVVMVGDDSLTVRKITSRLLEREGYQVLTAKDGIDALEQIEQTVPAVMLVDIEMPRMDGFDLAKHVRSDPRTRGVPIIIISSRTADKHRNHAAELGVNVFLGKPYPEAELLQHIATYAGAGQRGNASGRGPGGPGGGGPGSRFFFWGPARRPPPQLRKAAADRRTRPPVSGDRLSVGRRVQQGQRNAYAGGHTDTFELRDRFA